MFKEIFNETSADMLSSIALVIFVTVFVLVIFWVLSRSKKTIQRWSNMPLEDDTPQDPWPSAKAAESDA